MAVLPETGTEGATVVANEILKKILSLNIPHEFSEASQCVTMSIGVASVIPEEGSGTGDLVNMADEVLYKVKEGGRNNVKCAGFS